MQQLAPIIKHHFWILLVVGLITAFVGWWMATGDMQAATTARKAAIDAAVNQIPKPADEIPSKDWEQQLKSITEVQKEKVIASRKKLYAQQAAKMVWPEVMHSHMVGVKYRGDFNIAAATIFRGNYIYEWERVYKIPRPFQIMEDGVIDFPQNVLFQRNWGNNKPTSKEMWDAMEDLWLYEPLLNAILKANGGPDATPYDAVVTKILELRLYGGDRSRIGQMPTGAPAGGGGGGGLFSAMNEDDGVSPAGGGMAQRTYGAQSASIEFSPYEEFGDPGNDAPGGGGGGPPTGGFSVAAGDEAELGGLGGGFNSSFAGGDPNRGRRYIDDGPSLPYRTRGFKLTVIMDHQKLPELYAALTSDNDSPWPIQIVRMHLQSEGREGLGMPSSSPQGMAGGVAIGGNVDDEEDRTLGGNTSFGGGQFFNPLPVAGPGSTRPVGRAPVVIENPYMAKVTLAGIITLYNEPEAVPGAASPAAPPTSPAAPGDVTAAETESPAADEAAAAEGATDASAAAAEGDEMPAAEEGDVPAAAPGEEPATEEPTTEEPATEESPTEEPATEESPPDKS